MDTKTRIWILITLLFSNIIFTSVADNYLRIIPEQVTSGDQIEIELCSPSDTPFISQVRIYKDRLSSSSSLMYSGVNIGDEQMTIQPGTPFTVTKDLLNYSPGRYYFVTFSSGHGSVNDSIEVLPAPEVVLSETHSGLYSKNGQQLAVFNQPVSMPTLTPGTVYVLAVNLTELDRFKNTVHVDYYDPEGRVLLKADLLKIKIIREGSFTTSYTPNGESYGTPVDTNAYTDGIVKVLFRTPAHHKYYETDGQFHFYFEGVSASDPEDKNIDFAFEANWDDDPAHQAIQEFDEYNEENFPSELWRTNFPVDSSHIRLVRFGSIGLTSNEDLEEACELLEEHFSIATKDYFNAIVDGYSIFPLSQDLNRSKVTDWYESVPKTPGKDILDLNDPDHLYCATLLYYCEHNESEFVSDMQKIYPQGTNGEDITIYLFDGPGNLGQAMGAGALRVMVTRLYPGAAFYTGSGSSRTYHFDTDMYIWLNSMDDYLDFHRRAAQARTIVNISIHELGHVYWSGKAGISTGDLSYRRYPSSKDYVYEDASIGFFAKNEYMSYERNRRTLSNLTYGDAYLERILTAYPDLNDFDGDGMPNGWEWKHFGNPTVCEAADDSDADGLVNIKEYQKKCNPVDADTDDDNQNDGDELIAGTDPTDKDDRFEISATLIQQSNDELVFNWNTSSGKLYTVYSRTNLVQGSWVTNLYRWAGDGSTKSYTHENQGADQCFFRIAVESDTE